MPYGIEPESFEYVTDSRGQRIKALVPVSTLNALVEFWCAARRAQSDAHEVRDKPHLRPAPLRVMTSTSTSEAEPPPKSTTHPLARDQRWQKLVEKLPEHHAPPPLTLTAAEPPETPPAKPPKHSKQTFYPREFTEPIPAEVAERIAAGVYFIKAWRLYRKLTVRDVGDLSGVSAKAAGFHEYGYGRPTPRTLKGFAEAFDCSLAQLTVKPGTDTAPWSAPVKPEPPAEPRASEDTDYPDVVLAHLLDGKTPLTAWRLYRKLSLAQLGQAYGTQAFNVKRMETQNHLLTRRTREKLAAVLHCTPEQLLRPEGLEVRQREAMRETPTSRRIVSAMAARG